MKRWNTTDMVDIGRKLFAKIHKQKHHANHNHDVHFMARDINNWLVQGVESMVDKNVRQLAVSRAIGMVFKGMLGFNTGNLRGRATSPRLY